MPSTLLSEPINRFWYGYAQHSTPAEYILERAGEHGYVTPTEQALLELTRLAFTAGARWNLRMSAQLSPFISQFLEMCVLLGPDPPRDAWLDGIEDAKPRPDDGYDEWCAHVPF